jgi:DNA polymerase-1
MTTLILDIESDGLIPLIKNIWLVCTKVVETGDKRSFRSREDFQQYVSDLNPTLVVGHNVTFDLEALRRIWGIEYKWDTKGCSFNGKPVRFLDTLQLSQFLNADRQPGHSLESWGEKLGLEKIDFKDWSGYSEEMRVYCERDVDLTELVYKRLIKELEDYER